MNPQTNCNVMVLSPESGEDVHPFWYAQVLSMFHARVLHMDPAAANKSIQNIEFLWVRWLGLVPGRRFGFKQARLPKVSFLPHTDSLVFGFLDPSLVLRGYHLIPAFTDGKTSDLLPVMRSVARSPDEHEDWAAFYVMMYSRQQNRSHVFQFQQDHLILALICMCFYYYRIYSTHTNAHVPDLLTGICSCITGVVVLGM